MTSPVVSSGPAASASLPDWHRVLAVVAHPDDESFGLGAVLHAFAERGAVVSLLCLTRGEASVLGRGPDLVTVRTQELRAAAQELGAVQTTLLHHPDGELTRVRRHLLADDVIDEVGGAHPDGILVFDSDGVNGHPDHTAATSAALLAAAVLDLPVLAWTLPAGLAARLNEELDTSFSGRPPEGIHIQLPVDRERQLAACRAHRSQAVPSSALWRRLELQENLEYLRWLRRPTTVEVKPTAARPPGLPPNERTARARHLGNDRFEVTVRGHAVTVDQPAALGGDDTAPSPTELLVASVASCVAFYVRRYLTRHEIPTEGFEVDAEYEPTEEPIRIGAIRIRVRLPVGFPEERWEALRAVSSHCVVYNTLLGSPEVTFTLVPPASG